MASISRKRPLVDANDDKVNEQRKQQKRKEMQKNLEAKSQALATKKCGNESEQENIIAVYVCGHDLDLEVKKTSIDILHASASFTKGAEDSLAANALTGASLYSPRASTLQNRVKAVAQEILSRDFVQCYIFSCGAKKQAYQEFSIAEILQREIVKAVGGIDFFVGTKNKSKILKTVNSLQELQVFVDKTRKKLIHVTEEIFIVPNVPTEIEIAQTMFENCVIVST